METMKAIVLTEHQIQSLLYTLSDIIEVYDEGDEFDQTVANDLRDIQKQVRALHTEEV